MLHPHIIQNFIRLLANNRLAHGYLFVGAEGIGKSETALAVAKLVNCIQKKKIKEEGETFCDECSTCQRITNGRHPDVFVGESQGPDSVKIEQVREWINRTQLLPFEALKKVFIIKNVENVTLESGHALLKTLEEPSPSNLFILTTAKPENVLDTIRSRCHTLHFYPLSYDELAGILIKDYDISNDEAYFLAGFSQGCLGKAKKLIGRDFIRQKNETIDHFFYRATGEDFVKTISADKERMKDTLEILLSFLRDLILLKGSLEQVRCLHADRRDDLIKLTAQYDFDHLLDIQKDVVHAAELLAENLNLKIPLLIIKEKLWEGSLKYN